MLIGNRGKFVLALLMIVSILAAFEHDAEAADAPTFGTDSSDSCTCTRIRLRRVSDNERRNHFWRISTSY